MSKDIGSKLLEGIEALKVKATKPRSSVESDRLEALRSERRKLVYGRLFCGNRSTATFDYKRAWFGSAPTDESFRLVRAVPADGCGRLLGAHQGFYKGKVVLADRGRCTFVDKAWRAQAGGARGLLVLNDRDSPFERPASGYATDKKETPTPGDLAVALLDASAAPALLGPATAAWWQEQQEWASARFFSHDDENRRRKKGDASFQRRDQFLFSLEMWWNWRATRAARREATRDTVDVRFVPAKCRSGSPTCDPLLPEEAGLPKPADSGYLLFNNERFEFVAGAWGTILPSSPLRLARADPPDLCDNEKAPRFFSCRTLGLFCSPEETSTFAAKGAAILVDRGNCNFTQKAAQVARLKGALMIVVDHSSQPLLQMGTRGHVSVPGILVAADTGAALLAAASNATISLEVADPGFAKDWLDLLNVPLAWPEDDHDARQLLRSLEKRNANSKARLHWITKSYHNDRKKATCDDDDDETPHNGGDNNESSTSCLNNDDMSSP